MTALNIRPLSLLLALLPLGCRAALVDSVDPMIGAVTYPDKDQQGRNAGDGAIHGCGKTFPGATTPFGQVQLSPDTVTGGDHGSGYSYPMKTIEGFSMLHMSGIGWYGEFGNFQVMPMAGETVADREKAASPFSHSDETAKAGYYRVRLDRHGIDAELTASRTCGFLRFAYPTNETAKVKIDLGRRIGQKSRWLEHSEQKIDVRGTAGTIEGFMKCPDSDGGWGRGAGKVNYTVYFHGQFSEPISSTAFYEKNDLRPGGHSALGTNLVFVAEFGRLTRPLTMKVGISFTSSEDARSNFEREAKNVGFDSARLAARRNWEQAMDVIRVTGGTERERTIFATALYHAMLDPREIGQGDGFTRRTVFSGWDVFRSEMPLLTLVRPEVVSDTISSMMETVTSGKRKTLPRWDIFGCQSGCMIGEPIIPVMADAYEKGIRDFNVGLALKLADEVLARESQVRRHGVHPRGLSETLEYAYDEWCYGRLAELSGHPEEAQRGYVHAMSYTNCWSEEVGWMRSRNANKSWYDWKGREVHGQGCIESNPWQQGWFVPHDVEGLVKLMGGCERFTAELEKFFDATPDGFGWCDSYNHPNEPCHTLPFLFAHSTKPELTSKWTRKICEKAYDVGPYGLCGNDDVGQMSAWYVLAAIGIHPICPGDGRWILTAPLFTETTIRLDPKYYTGGTFTIRAPKADKSHWRIASAKLNGKVLDRPWILSSEITPGGVLDLALAE